MCGKELDENMIDNPEAVEEFERICEDAPVAFIDIN
jgi:hypothetical protein